MPWSHIAIPSWCECTQCCKTAKEDENVCCGVQPCRSVEFKQHLEATLTDSYLKRSEEYLACHEDLSDMGKLRRVCYQEASSYFHKNDWYPQDKSKEIKYAALPNCIVWTIRRQYKEENGKYTGFPPKSELLQKVVDARKTFRGDMEAYKTVVDVANPHNGLFTVLQKLQPTIQLNAVYDILQDAIGATSTAAECEERWTNSTNRGIELLPKLAFVACATTFEAFVYDTIICCLDTVFSTRKVINNKEEFWRLEFDRWLKSRVSDSEVWTDKEHECETNFWINFPGLGVKSNETTNTQNQNATLLNLERRWQKIGQYLGDNPTTQEAVGLVQEMVNNKKQNIIGTLRSTTMQHIQETFTRLAVEASNGSGTRKRKGKSSMKPSKEPKTTRKPVTAKRAEDLSGQSPSTSGSSMSKSNISSDISQSGSNASITTPTSAGSSAAQLSGPLETSTPLHATASSKTHTEAESAIKRLICHYASQYTWQIWPDGASRDVKCKSAESLSYLSNLFYGMRCIFSHGRPQKTLEFGAMRVDRTPRKSSEFNISIPRQGRTDEECVETKKLCESYLFDVATNARETGSQMTVDHSLFLTAQSFYAYAVEIIGSVAACIACKYSDVKLSEKATHVDRQRMQEIKKTIVDVWKCAAAAIATSTSSKLSSSMDVTSDDLSVLETASAAPSTGLTQDFSDFSFQ